MNVRPILSISKAAFIEWSAVEEERCELVAGRVVMMPRPSLAHGMIVMNLAVLLRTKLNPTQWVVVAKFGLDSGPETLRYPDLVVDRAGGSGKSYTASAPVLLAEVLSPSSVEIDLGDKLSEYLRLPSLVAYIVLSQDEPKAWVYVRADAQFTLGPAVIRGAEAVVRIAPLQLELPMAEVYAGIKVG
jgi:Uma2 family endonuclease